jgi:hypothetical protein
MDHAVGSLRAVIPTITERHAPPIQAGAKAADHAVGMASDRLKAGVQASGRALKVVGETLFPGMVGPGVLVSGAITVGLGALTKTPMRQSLISAGSYAASMVAGNLAYRAVHALHGSDFAGRMTASAVGTAIGIGEAALLKRPTSFITLLANSIGAGYGAGQAAKSIAKHQK